MSSGATGDHDEGGPRHDELDLVLSVAARQMVRGVQWPEFLGWMRESGPTLVPSMMAQLEDPAVAPALFGFLARLIWNRTPQPTHGYRVQPLPKPERNAPCFCGSGRKYKQCCAALEGATAALPSFSMLPYLLDCLSQNDLRALPRGRLSLEELGGIAGEWLDKGDAKRAVALLEPIFEDVATLDDRAELAFDVLCNAYLDLQRSGKKRRLVHALMAAPDRWLRAVAMQREVSILSDMGEFAAAWRLFREAQQAEPDHPSLAHLEVTILVAEGRHAEARERARFWAARLARANDPELASLIDFLRRCADRPEAAMLDVADDRVEGLAEFRELLAAMPPPEVHYTLRPEAESAGPLLPDRALAALEREWADVFPAEEPELTSFVANAVAWEDARPWVDWLREHPLAWQSFRVLDELAAAAAFVPLALNVGETLGEDLFRRGETLLRMTIAQNRAEGLRLEWAWHENRPALRLVVAFGAALARAGEAECERELLEWLVLTLNPNDNHGLRETLMARHLAAGRVDAALDLASRYPDDDLATMQFDVALALFMAGRKQEAADALHRAGEQFPEVLPMLLAPRSRKPKLDAQWVTRGGRDEAWLYRESSRALWEQSGALDWVKSATAGARRRRGG
jgi:tetratricopeptide (TPR) repeat protein